MLVPTQMPPYLSGSAPVLASMARHVVDDFMFDRNMVSGSVSSYSSAWIRPVAIHDSIL